MQNRCRVAIAILATLLVGCNVGPFSRPPGTIARQQQAATLHDPYPDRNLGPEIVGGRPRDFQQPRAEAVRSEWLWPRPVR